MSKNKLSNTAILSPVKPSPFYVRNWFILAVLLLFTFVVFESSTHYNFVEWDDNEYVYQNQDIQSLSFHNIAQMFSKPYVGMYSPLAIVTYAFDYQLGEYEPYFYHLSNLFWHLANVVIAYFLFLRLTRRKLVAVIVAAVFALHPMHVESVVWVSERKDVTYTFFYLLSLWFYIYYLERGKHNKPFSFLRSFHYWAALFFFLLSCFSKSAAVTLPALLLLFDWYFERMKTGETDSKQPKLWQRFGWLTLEKVPFGIISVAFIIVSMFTQADAITNLTDMNISFLWHPLVVIYASVYYIVQFFVPVHLAYLHPFIFELTWQYYVAPIVWLLIGLLFYFKKDYRRILLFGFGFYLITIILTLHIIPVGMSVVSERYAYVPYFGLAFIIAVIIAKWTQNPFHKKKEAAQYELRKRLKSLIYIGVALWLLGLGLACYYRLPAWKDTYQLAEDGIEKHPYNYGAWFMRGNARMSGLGCEPSIEKAILDYTQSIRVSPNMLAFMNRGNARIQFADPTGALKDLDMSIQLTGKASGHREKESIYMTYYCKADILRSFGTLDSALVYYRRALQYHPEDTIITNTIREVQEEIELAKKQTNPFERLLQATQDDIFRQDYASAMNNVNEAIKVQPDEPRGYAFRAEILFYAKLYQAALDDMTRAIELLPDNNEYYYNRANLHLLLEHRQAACADFKKSLQLGKQEARLPIAELCQ